MSGQLNGVNDDLGPNDSAAQGSEVEQVDQVAPTRDCLGKNATFGSAAVECRRVIDLQYNYYAVLKVTRSTPHTEVHHNWSRLRKIVGADNAAHLPLALAASSLCDTAFGTLKDPIKKALYDHCTSQAPTLKGAPHENWARTAESEDREVPKVVHRLLNCPGGSLVTCFVFIPGLVVSILVTGLMWLLVMPFRMVWRCLVWCLQVSETEGWSVKKSAEVEKGWQRQPAGKLDIAVVGISNRAERGKTLKRADGTWSRIAEGTEGLEFGDANSNDGPG